MSKIVVVVRAHVKISDSLEQQNEYKEYPNAIATNNERGVLIITQGPKTIAVFKEWVYWEKVE